MDDGSLISGFMILALLLIAYIFPCALAAYRDCKATAAIVIIDLFLGWTFVGWVVALAWAASGEKKIPQPAAPAAK